MAGEQRFQCTISALDYPVGHDGQHLRIYGGAASSAAGKDHFPVFGAVLLPLILFLILLLPLLHSNSLVYAG